MLSRPEKSMERKTKSTFQDKGPSCDDFNFIVFISLLTIIFLQSCTNTVPLNSIVLTVSNMNGMKKCTGLETTIYEVVFHCLISVLKYYFVIERNPTSSLTLKQLRRVNRFYLPNFYSHPQRKYLFQRRKPDCTMKCPKKKQNCS